NTNAVSNQAVSSISVSLPSAPLADSLVITTVHTLFGAPDPTNPSGYTTVGSPFGDALVCEVAEAEGASASQSVTWGVSSDACAGTIIVEFQAASAAPPEGVELAAAEVLPALGEAQAASVSALAAAAEVLPALTESLTGTVDRAVAAALAE